MEEIQLIFRQHFYVVPTVGTEFLMALFVVLLRYKKQFEKYEYVCNINKQ